MLNITLVSTEPEPKAKPFNIVFEGRVIGRVEPKQYDDGRIWWLSDIDLTKFAQEITTTLHMPECALGHGDTPEEAIRNGIIAKRKRLDILTFGFGLIEAAILGWDSKRETDKAIEADRIAMDRSYSTIRKTKESDHDLDSD